MDQLPEITASTVPWWHDVLALIVVVAGFIVGRMTRHAVLRLLRRTRGIPESLAEATARFASYLVIFLGIGIGLAAIGIDIQPLIAIVIIVVVIIAFVLKGVADNFAAGVLLQASHPVMPGDDVTVEIPDGTATGTVVELGTRTVIVQTYDGRTVHVPNARFVADAIVVTPADTLRRTEIEVRTARGEAAVSDTLARIAEIAATVEGVDPVRAASVTAGTIAPERLTARLRFWHTGKDAATVTAAVVLAVAAALEADGLEATVTSLAAPVPPTPPEAV